MQSFLSRLTRPFSSAGTLRFGPDAAGGSGSGSGSGVGSATAGIPAGAQKATVAAGCFWGVEHVYRKAFGGRDGGLLDARVGYIGGSSKNPSYRSVCSGATGHAEACQLVFDPSRVSYAQLLEFFYRMHDPTTADRQGPDAGSQYRSAIFAHDAEQARIAHAVTDKANAEWWKGKIVTQILSADGGDDAKGVWYDAEGYHQEYLANNPGGYECPSHFIRKFPPLST